MNYDTQCKFLLRIFNKYPRLRSYLHTWRGVWHEEHNRNFSIIILGQPIADKVIRDLDLIGENEIFKG